MKYYKIADLILAAEGIGEPLKKKMKPYEMNSKGKADLIMQIIRENMDKTGEQYSHLSPDEWEYIRTGFAFAYRLLDFEGFCFHASAVALHNRAVLFSGPCGTGKSTHAKLWQQYFGEDQAVIINDDKPALRLINDTFYAYGTPWSGKSDLNLNRKVPLQAIIFLKQSKENRIRCMDGKEAVQMLIYQSLRPNSDADKMDRLLALLDVLLKKTPVYQMECTVSLEAVKLAYGVINHERIE